MKTIIGLAFILTISIIILPLTISAQLNLENRIEIELKDGYQNEMIFKSSSGYFIIEAEAIKSKNGLTEIKYDQYDGNLKKNGTASTQIAENLHQSLSYNDDTCIYRLYRSKDDYLLLIVRISDLNIKKINGTLLRGIYVSEMGVVGSKAWFQGKVKRKSCIVQIDLNSGKSRISEFVEKRWNKNTRIINFQMDPKTNELQVFLNSHLSNQQYKLTQVKVNHSCELCEDVQLTGTNDKIITSVSGYKISSDKTVYSGTYSNKSESRSIGLFFAGGNGDNLNFINYINFLDLKNFLSYMTERQQNKIEKKKARKKSEGKEFSINYYIASHDIIVLPDGYLLVGEAYYPTYHTTTYTTYSYSNGMSMPVTHVTTSFDGYRYTHAFVARFSENGKLIWDQCFEMNPFEKPFYVKKFIQVSQQQDEIGLVFASRSQLVSKVLNLDGTIQKDETRELILSGNENEKTVRTFSNADYWFGNNFLVYGTQKVINTDNKDKRRVFFVNKVTY
jgi:hypothetical protein